MFLDLIIAACAALAAVGTIYAAFRLFRAKPPRWLLPLAAGLAMIGVTATLRYQWADNLIARMPPQMVVLERFTEQSPLEPWSLVHPVETRLLVADTNSIRRHPDHPSLVMIELSMLRRDAETVSLLNLVDCAGRQVAPLPANAEFGPDGLPVGLGWMADAPPTLFEAACPVPSAEPTQPAEPADTEPVDAEPAEAG